MVFDKPYAPACDKNKGPILEVLRKHFRVSGQVLEIGSGTGQHAVYFAQHLPHLEWQPSDLAENLRGIRQWCDGARLANLRSPMELDVNRVDWRTLEFDCVFSANTAHILCWQAVERMFAGIGACLKPGGLLALYGPFNYAGSYTSESNAQFDLWLKRRDPASGIRNFEDVNRLAVAVGLSLAHDYAMPANNRTLVWARS